VSAYAGRHEHGIQSQFAGQRRLHRPANAPCVRTDLPPPPDTTSPASADVGNVGHPRLIVSIDGELSIEMIGALIEGRPVIGRGAL